MLKPAPPLTTAQRQAMFQASHPGYDRRRKARGRLSREARRLKQVALLAQLRAEAESAAAGNEAGAASPELTAPAADSGGQLLLFPAMRPAA